MPGKYLNDVEFLSTTFFQGLSPVDYCVRGEYESGLNGNYRFALSGRKLDDAGQREKFFGEYVFPESENVALGMIGGSDAFRGYVRDLKNITGGRDIPPVVLVTGETGTGKELAAKALYFAGPRRNETFYQLDLGAISCNPQLFTLTTYGTRTGSFTDAMNQKGAAELARNGIMHIDEIGSLKGHDDLQFAFLRLLEGKPVSRVGDTKSYDPNIKIIVSTNEDLERGVREGKIRRDLYYRLNQARIHVPPLRERREDVPLFVDYYARLFRQYDGRSPLHISEAEMDMMTRYPWDGNVRELQNVVRKSVIAGSLQMPGQRTDSPYDVKPDSPYDVKPEILKILRSNPPSDWTAFVKSVEGQFLQDRLGQNGGNMKKTARELGMKRTTLLEKMKRQYGYKRSEKFEPLQ